MEVVVFVTHHICHILFIRSESLGSASTQGKRDNYHTIPGSRDLWGPSEKSVSHRWVCSIALKILGEAGGGGGAGRAVAEL